MSRAGLVFAALAALVVSSPARAYVRSTDSKTNACLYWGSRSVSYRINFGRTGNTSSPAPASPTCGTSVEQNAVTTGFAQWTGASESCTDLSLVFDATPGSSTIGYNRSGANENTVVFRAGWCSDTRIVPASDPCWGANPDTSPAATCANVFNCFDDTAENGRQTLALTTVTYAPSSGQIFDADMELNGWSGADLTGNIPASQPPDAWYLTCTDPSVTNRCGKYGDGSCVYIDVQNTATHEAGHFIGLAHPCVQGASCTAAEQLSTMYPYSGAGDYAKRNLAQDDVAGLCTIYPAGQATATCATTSSAPKSGGCAAGGEGALPAILLALAAIAPRLRRRG